MVLATAPAGMETKLVGTDRSWLQYHDVLCMVH
jgi:hypothetical protein